MTGSALGERSDVQATARVLVVDDDPAVRRLLVRVLASRGFGVVEAATGGSALDAVTDGVVDLVILDRLLPDIDGFEVLGRLRGMDAARTLPVIMLTAAGHATDRVVGLEAGADDYLVKPVDLDELVARVRAHLRGREAWRYEVEEALHQRAGLAAALASVAPAGPAEEIAAEVASLLTGLPGIEAVAIVQAGELRHARVIGRAGAGPFLPSGSSEALAPSVLAEIRQALSRYPGDYTLLPPPSARRLFPGTNGLAAVMGLFDGGELLGAVVLDLVDEDAVRSTGAAAFDLLPLVHRVLDEALSRSDGPAVGAELSRIITECRFDSVFQPICDLASEAIVGFEALTRFDDGVRPDLRFAEAGRLGLGAELEVATLRSALSASRALPAGAYLSLNTSVGLLMRPELGEVLAVAAPDRPLVLEITEHERVEDYPAVRAAVAALGRDVRLSVDDAGSGWASLRHVLALQPDMVKVDRGWVQDLETDPARQALLLGITQFVNLSGGVVVAEGIENHRELATVRQLGIRFGQGYLLGRPAPARQHRGS